MIYSSNKSRQKQYSALIEIIENHIKLYIEQAKCSTVTFGMKNSNYLFRRCDIYITENAIILFAYSAKSFFKELSSPIILTNDNTENASYLPPVYKEKVNSIRFENNNVKINFGEKNLTKTEVTILFQEFSEEQMQAVKMFSEKNCW